MSEHVGPVDLREPSETGGDKRDIWLRGLWMLAFALFFGIAETVLLVVALVQFLWMLTGGERNRQLARFGRDLGKWLRDVAEFQSGARDEKPFPWAKWG